jgi:hypothetical protein
MTVDCSSNGTDVGDAIVAIWADILGSADVSLATNVLEAGANSIHLLLALNRIRDLTDGELDPASIFAYPVIGDFVAICTAREPSEQMEEFDL